MTKPSLEQEFDNSVNQYNQWLLSHEDPKTQDTSNQPFFKGIKSLLNIFNPDTLKPIHPLYSRKDLTSFQKDTIAIASDWQRVDTTLDRVLNGNSSRDEFSITEATQGKQIVTQMYGLLRDTYVASKTK